MYIKPRQTKENIITAITNEITQKETQKKLIISLLSSVQSYKGTQINKRLCTHIENETEKIKQQIEKWNPETRKDEQTTRMIPIFNTSLEKKIGQKKLIS